MLPAMIICMGCGHRNRVGTLFCEECGKILVEHPRDVNLSELHVAEGVDRQSMPLQQHAGSGGISLKLQIVGEPELIEMLVSASVVLGRADVSVSSQPDVDLEPFGAVAKGVSRRHAIIGLMDSTVVIEDAGSANGTYLNGEHLSPHQQRIVHNGDEVRLGRLVTRIYLD